MLQKRNNNVNLSQLVKEKVNLVEPINDIVSRPESMGDNNETCYSICTKTSCLLDKIISENCSKTDNDYSLSNIINHHYTTIFETLKMQTMSLINEIWITESINIYQDLGLYPLYTIKTNTHANSFYSRCTPSENVYGDIGGTIRLIIQTIMDYHSIDNNGYIYIPEDKNDIIRLTLLVEVTDATSLICMAFDSCIRNNIAQEILYGNRFYEDGTSISVQKTIQLYEKECKNHLMNFHNAVCDIFNNVILVILNNNNNLLNYRLIDEQYRRSYNEPSYREYYYGI